MRHIWARFFTGGLVMTNEKKQVVNILKENGCRITKQRLLLIDVILKGEYSCCKQVYYDAVKLDPTIGMATVYRMINTLRQYGVINQ